MNEHTDSGNVETVDKRLVLVVVAMAAFLQPFLSASINVAIPSIGKEYSADAVTLSWISMAVLLAAAVSMVPFGKLSDMYGRKKLLLGGASLIAVSCLGCIFAPSILVIIIFQIIQGIGCALVMTTAFAMIPSVFPPQERGRALGLTVAAVYSGLSTGPFIGGLLTQHVSWRGIFVLAAVLAAIVIGLGFTKIRAEWSEAGTKGFDLLGSIAYGLALMAICYGLSRLPELTGIVLIPIGIVFLVGFIVWESRIANPVLEVKLFRSNRLFAMANLVVLLNYSATFALTFLLSMNLQYVHGLSAQDAGFILLAMPVIMVIGSPIAGRISDKLDARRLTALGMSLMTVGLALLAVFGGEGSLGLIIGCLVINGLGYALFSSPNMNVIMGSVEKTYYGVASAVISVMRMVGQTLSMSVATLLIAVIVGNVEISPTYYTAFLVVFRVAFIIFTVMSFAGIIFSLIPDKAQVNAAVSGNTQ